MANVTIQKIHNAVKLGKTEIANNVFSLSQNDRDASKAVTQFGTGVRHEVLLLARLHQKRPLQEWSANGPAEPPESRDSAYKNSGPVLEALPAGKMGKREEPSQLAAPSAW